MTLRTQHPAHHRQGGASLIVVLVMLLLAAITLVGTTRRVWLNDRGLGNEADQQRAFAAAEALLRDAELDIQGLRADGTQCPATPSPDGCRSAASTTGFFPVEDGDLDRLQAHIGASHQACLAGLCLPADPATLASAWDSPAKVRGMSAVGATYGRFTGAPTSASGNPLLDSATPRGWYWIEVFRYSDAGAIQTGTVGLPVPDPSHPYVYRIHAVVQGMRPGTQVHLRSLFVPRPVRS